jgi:uncharacterized membrane protein YdjX (TVP38/TMEM64 family)
MSRRLLLQIALIVVAAAGLAAIWLWLPIRDYADPDAVARLTAPVVESPWLPLIVLGAFLVAGAVMLSVWVVIFQTCLLYSPLVAFPLALGGATLSAMTFYGVGRLLGRDVVMRLVPPRVQQALERVTLESIIAVRVLPLLPFTLVNMTCGAFGVPVRTFFLGTLLGMAPGVLGMTLVGDRILAVIRQPTPGAIVGLVAVVAVLVLVARFFRKRAAARYLQDAVRRDNDVAAASATPPPAAP